MYEQYVLIRKRLLDNKSRLVIVENELEKLISKTNMKYVSPSFIVTGKQIGRAHV